MRTGVILANTGTPAEPTSEAVAEYLQEFLSDPRIVPLPPLFWKPLLKHVVLPRRSPRSAARYRLIWTEEGSPLAVHMEALARSVERSLAESGLDIRVEVGMGYGAPSLAYALERLRSEGCERLIALPLYPQTAFSTTSSLTDGIHAALDRIGWQPPLHIGAGYAAHPAYIAALAQSVREAGFGAEPGDRLLIAYHSIPLADIRAGDTYADQCEETTRLLVDALGLPRDAWRRAYHCRFDRRRKWLGPFIEPTLEELRGAGRVFVVSPIFAVDCLETLYDIGHQLRDLWRSYPEDPARFLMVPCLNASAAHVRLVSALVEKGIEGLSDEAQSKPAE